jgi:hypothetical protein
MKFCRFRITDESGIHHFWNGATNQTQAVYPERAHVPNSDEWLFNIQNQWDKLSPESQTEESWNAINGILPVSNIVTTQPRFSTASPQISRLNSPRAALGLSQSIYKTIPNAEADLAANLSPADQPIHQTHNSGLRPSDGIVHQQLYHNPAWWGAFVDDTPQKDNETDLLFRRRYLMAVDNMRIKFRAPEPDTTQEQYTAAVREHDLRMSCDVTYRENFISDAHRVHEENERKRAAALEYRNESFARVAREQSKQRTSRAVSLSTKKEWQVPIFYCNETDLYEVGLWWDKGDPGDNLDDEEKLPDPQKFVGNFGHGRTCSQCFHDGTENTCSARRDGKAILLQSLAFCIFRCYAPVLWYIEDYLFPKYIVH